ncbi:tyrosinase family protein [Aspergillus foveolatus]|uniref:tyrosinase family protein n=1 Tax=Aspergillus foveolatus TaxID=210207 RepID=UPI003CCDFDF8
MPLGPPVLPEVNRTALTPPQRSDYINSVRCMTSQPSLLAGDTYPGVKHRMDDFIAVHISYSLSKHASGIFLAWHRHYIWLWEQALRDECGYSGSLPPTSLSGDGTYDPNDVGFDLNGETLPRGTGGGCVASGPFKNLTLRMGPFPYELTSQPTLPDWAFAYNPRCFTRSLNSAVLTCFNSDAAVSALLASPDVTAFQQKLDGFPNPEKGVAGLHTGGHLSLGEPMQDAFAGPQDPAFMLHHAMVDRLWALWQEMDRGARLVQTNGTSTIFNAPRTPEVTLDTVVEFGGLGKSMRLGDLMDSSRYCYIYE